jgi:hypothetical protein
MTKEIEQLNERRDQSGLEMWRRISDLDYSTSSIEKVSLWPLYNVERGYMQTSSYIYKSHLRLAVHDQARLAVLGRAWRIHPKP